MSSGPDRFSVDLSGQALDGGRLQVEEKLDEGGMGTVYTATQTSLGRRVIVKVPHVRFLGEPGFRERFAREIKRLIGLEHPHIVSILTQGEHEDVPYFVLQYLAGGSLSSRLRSGTGGRQTVAEVMAWLPEVAKALDFVHRRDVIHRDVKPANILFDDDDNVFLSDFGIAKALGDGGADATSLTGTGAGIGSPSYMSPEQGMGRDIDATADQYALAATVYEALGGRPPFEGGTPMEMVLEKVQRPPPDLRASAPNLAPGVCAAVMRGLAIHPRDRHPSCRGLVEAIRAGLEGKSRAAAAPTQFEGSEGARTRTILRGVTPSGPARARETGGEQRRGLPARRPRKSRTGLLSAIMTLLFGATAGLYFGGFLGAGDGGATPTDTSRGPRPGGLSVKPEGADPASVSAAEVPSWAQLSKAQMDEAKRLGIPVAIENEFGMRFVLIPAGTFQMGSPAGEEGRGDDEHQHSARLTKAYYMSIHELTNAQYRRFKSDHDSGSEFNGASQPAVLVSHDDVVAYAKWLSGRESGRTYRLPTEAEWERACRGGTTSRYSWGASEALGPKYANATDPVTKKEFGFTWDSWPTDDGHRVAAPVGHYRPNPYGLYDMHGNVWEWCSDWFLNEYYETSSARSDPVGPSSGTLRVIRGGSWNDQPRGVRCAYRRRLDPTRRTMLSGGRLVFSAR